MRRARRNTDMEEQDKPYFGKNPKLQVLRQRSMAEWNAELAKIPDCLAKDKARCVIWWDYLSEGRADSNPEVMAFKPAFGSGHDSDPKAVEKILVALGYPDRFAEKRGKEPRSYVIPGARKESCEKSKSSSKTEKTCVWTREEYRKYLIFDASTVAVEYKPTCEGSGAWSSGLPKYCPWCGRRTKSVDKPKEEA